MTGTAWLFLTLFGAVAAVDWVAVVLQRNLLEYVAKPGCVVLLIAAAATMDADDGAARALLLVALVLSIAGDVFLMLPGRRPGSRGPDLFVAGLGAFLLAHVAYVVGFVLDGVRLAWIAQGLIVAVTIAATVGRRVVAAARASPEPDLAAPVAAYVGVISLMVVAAIGTADPRAIVGCLLFAGSDSLIAWGRFVQSMPWFPLAIIVSYHVAQALLTVSFSG